MTYQRNAYLKFIDSKGLGGEALDRFEAFIATGYTGHLYTLTWDEIATCYKAWRRADQKAEPDEAAHYRCDG